MKRDSEPDNIFLVPDAAVPGGERVKLLDFGIAKFLSPAGGQTTTSDLILGSPRYMAPEQCEGREELSSKADVYSLGVIFYELLAGERPFNALSPAALLRQHITMKPPPLRERAPKVSEDLAALIHDMLAKNGAERPSTEQVLARLDGDGARGRRLRRRAIIFGLTLLPVLLLLTGWRLLHRPTTRPPAPAAQVAPPTLAAPPPPHVPSTAPPAPTPLAAAPAAPPPALPAVQPPVKKRHRATAKREESAPADSTSPRGESQKAILKAVNFGKD